MTVRQVEVLRRLAALAKLMFATTSTRLDCQRRWPDASNLVSEATGVDICDPEESCQLPSVASDLIRNKIDGVAVLNVLGVWNSAT